MINRYTFARSNSKLIAGVMRYHRAIHHATVRVVRSRAMFRDIALPTIMSILMLIMPSLAATAQSYSTDSLIVLQQQQDGNKLHYPVVAFRSNLLQPLLNVGIEVPIAKHWSLGADYYYPWFWPAKNNKNCFELLFVSAEARYWFATNRKQQMPEKNYLAGHSIGVYGAWGYYDFEHNYHGHQGDGWSVGIDYLYALPIAKGKLRMEFQLALGALWSLKAQPYNVYEDGGHLIRERGHRKNFSYLGPTKLGVSLVVPIFRSVKQSASQEP